MLIRKVMGEADFAHLIKGGTLRIEHDGVVAEFILQDIGYMQMVKAITDAMGLHERSKLGETRVIE